MNLKSLHEIFESRLMRIPDYQRGFAWRKHHEIVDFWEDLIHLNGDRVHYTGVITLEPVPSSIHSNWEEDKWLIEGLKYRPWYVVDGQQRLITSVILVQAILDSVEDGEILIYQNKEEIKGRYILKCAASGDKSYLFGYEKDNPSNEFLVTKIFGEFEFQTSNLQTLYTRNLENAKDYFKEQLSNLEVGQVQEIFKKLTQYFKFNLYEIDDEIDVFVTFETMNNRGKPLTSLELLKNRLIYLSTQFNDDTRQRNLRKHINDTWKKIYEYLGKNPEHSLSDDLFLKDHWTMYFNYSRDKANVYVDFLLKEKFTAQNVTHPASDDKRITIDEIENYVKNLRQSIEPWFFIHNPYFSNYEHSDDTTKKLLSQINRLGFGAFRPLLLAAFIRECSIENINNLLEAIEKYNFVLFKVSQRKSNTGDTKFYRYANELLNYSDSHQDDTILNFFDETKEWTNYYLSIDNFYNYISGKFKFQELGFYDWNGIDYFLFEYEECLRLNARLNDPKITWETFINQRKDYVTIEHIFPQNDDDLYWKELYKQYDDEHKNYLNHSLGNLLPLSRERNSKFQNYSFPIKKNNGKGVGYYNGSHSEIEVNENNNDWNAQDILERGLEMLDFMENRWNISIGDKQKKIELLHLGFLTSEVDLTEQPE